MRNRDVGFLIMGISAVIGFIIYSFNQALTEIVATSCTHGTSCPMWGTIEFQTNVSLALMALIGIIGAYLVFFGKGHEESIRIRKVETLPGKEIDASGLMKSVADMGPDAKSVLEHVIKSDGTIFQSELAEKTGLGKVKVTRVLDKLEGKGIVERKRRGMTNVVILKR
ncbi:MAG: MarR family transcriptional regulator [Candidatus Aenigmatarchaeota archaeon]